MPDLKNTHVESVVLYLNASIYAINNAITNTSNQAAADRRRSHAAHPDTTVALALTEMISIRTQLQVLLKRVETVGR